MALTLEELVRNARFTVFLGKNGSGKSTLLRTLDSSSQFETNYISPERGGTLKYDPGIDNTMVSSPNWLVGDRRKNRSEHFRQASAVQYRNLENIILREIEHDTEKRRDLSYTFDNTLSKINNLLPAIELRRPGRGFEIYSKAGNAIDEDQISSGEAELITLAIEILVFSREPKSDKVLLLDEPDVHLHPDLQLRFIRFIEDVAVEYKFRVVVATHSTAIIGAFSKRDDLQIVPITTRDQTAFKHFNYSPICHEILPIFGAHPLSAQFNRSPVLLVEGEDDKRVIDQFVRSANGQFLFSPCVVGTVVEMNEWEKWLNEFLPSIYDNPKGYSLRDLDNSPQCEIDDVGCVLRARLNCYAIENLLLTDECLAMYGQKPPDFQNLVSEWVSQRPDHPVSPALKELFEHFDDRRTIKIKDILNVLVALLGTQKPWEVVVGQLLAANTDSANSSKHSVHEYLGPSVIRKILGRDAHKSGAAPDGERSNETRVRVVSRDE